MIEIWQDLKDLKDFLSDGEIGASEEVVKKKELDWGIFEEGYVSKN